MNPPMTTSVLPAFATKFEDSATYRSYTAPSLNDLATELRSEEKRAAMEPEQLASRLTVLASRINTALHRATPSDEDKLLIDTLPQDLRSPLSVLEAAMAAAPDNLMIKSYHFLVENPADSYDNEVKAGNRATDAFEQDPTNGAALIVSLLTAFKTRNIKTLDVEHEIGTTSKTMREWMQFLVALDEYNSTSWHLLATCLDATASKENQQPSITIHATECNVPMVAARVLQLRRFEVAAFGKDAVPVGRFVSGKIPNEACQHRCKEATAMLARVMPLQEEITMDRLVRKPDGSFGTDGVETLTPVSVFADAAAIERNPRTWTRLGNAAVRANMTSVTVGKTTMSLPQCVANAAGLDPTEPRLWHNVMALLVEDAKRMCGSDDPQELVSRVQSSVVTVRGVELTGGACHHLAQNTPPDASTFAKFLADIDAINKQAKQEVDEEMGGQKNASPLARFASPVVLAGLGIAGVVCGVAAVALLRKRNSA